MIFTIPVASRVEDFDQEGLLTPHAVLSVFENTAIRHAETTGYSPMGDSLRNGMAWVITNWRVEVARAPSYDQPLTASTWLCRTPRQATREMLLRAADGEVLARGQAKLALVDRATGKPCLPTADRLAPYGPETATAFADRLPRLRPPARWDAETPVRLRRADIDYNGHLHNTASLALALDAAPGALCGGLEIKAETAVVEERGVALPLQLTEHIRRNGGILPPVDKPVDIGNTCAAPAHGGVIEHELHKGHTLRRGRRICADSTVKEIHVREGCNARHAY